MWLSSIFFGGFIVIIETQQYVSVRTNQGVVQGKTVNYGNDKNQLYYGNADVFLGIPYAQAPVGDQRFRAPRSVPNFNNVYDATYYRPKCPQADGGNYQNEDCLYLNVYTQQTGNATASMAVMMFVDGSDGLSSGGSDESQLKGTVRNLVSRGVVVVTFQYRLGALGFFSTTAAGFSSNNGMLDQVMAMQWVQQNIANFGGDPNKVTLAGQGDGACAVAAHTLSPVSQGLFQQAILQSGTIDTCYSADGTVTDPSTSPQSTTKIPVLQYDQGAPQLLYQPQSSNSQSSYGGNYQQNNQGYQQQYPIPGQANCPPPCTTNQFVYYGVTGQNYGNNVQRDQGYNNGYNQGNSQNLNQGYQNNYQSSYNQNVNTNQGTYPTTTPTTYGYNSANAQYDQTVNPSQKLAQQLCNITPQQWNSGQLGDLHNCLSNYTVDFFVQAQGKKVATWMIVRDNYFLPDTINNLAARRPPIPIIIGTVQDEDADYAFKLVANGQANESEGQMFNDWMVDFARKNKISQDQQASNQCANIISQNYNITPAQPTYASTQTPYQPAYTSTIPTNTNQFAPQRDQPTYQPSTTNVVSNPQSVQSLKTMSTITSDSGIVSQTSTEIDQWIQNGNRYVRVYQFTYASNLGRQGQPDLNGWQPVTKGTDQLFLFMSETVWSQQQPTPTDIQMADQMGDQWTQFAKTGQVNNWQTTNTNNYNYCDLSSTPSQKTGYGSQARNVFNDQVYPVVQQAQEQQQPYPQRTQQQSTKIPPSVDYNRNGDSSTFHITFQLPNQPVPFYG